MAENSFPWDGNSASGGTGDCGPYSSDEFRDWFRMLFCNDETTEFVVPLYKNTLSVASSGNAQVSIATGAAIVDGLWYENTSSTTKAVSAHAGRDSWYRIVLRANWTAQTVTLVALGGDATCPTVTQTDGTTWENSLALVQVSDASAVTVTDERIYLHFNTKIDADNIDSAVITGAKIATSAVSAANIANRSRKFVVEPNMIWNDTDSASLTSVWSDGSYTLQGDKDLSVYAESIVPMDYSSSMTVKAMVQCSASGNVANAASVWTAATNGSESAANSLHSRANVVEALATNKLTGCASVSLASAATGDFMTLKYQRLGATCAADTLSASLWFYGWLVDYTADM